MTADDADRGSQGARPIWPALPEQPAKPIAGTGPAANTGRAANLSAQTAPAPKPAEPADSAELEESDEPVVSSSPPLTGPLPERLSIALTLWKNKLLDLTKRNRALNFKPTKVSTVTIVDEQPVEVFKHLCIEERPMRFRPTLPSAGKKKAESEDEAPTLALSISVTGPEGSEESLEDLTLGGSGGDEPQGAEVDFAPYDPDALDERHRDDILQSLATPEALDKALRRIDDQARATLEEQGVNTLFLALGMLHYTEAADSEVVLRAPLVMVPCRLGRRSARSGYTIERTDEDALVNPALSEYLRHSFGIELPELPAADDPTAPKALQDFYEGISRTAAQRVAAGFKQWAVKTDIFLGFFAFQKLVMFKDLEKNATAFRGHRLVERLVSRDAAPGTYVMGLPNDVKTIDLDDEFAPEKTAQVVDADGSQLRAIAAVAKGHDLVIEGPPGTGKSQTITNLIAQALSDGKSVLFVAEKMAALQVVHRRLVGAGLGEFCLELHASKANKRQVMQDLKAALDASLQLPARDRRTHRLPSVRASLSAYSAAVHTPEGALALSPFRVTGMLEAVLSAPRVSLKRSIEDISVPVLQDAEVLLRDLSAAQAVIGPPRRHAWRDTGRTFYTPGALLDIGELLSTTATSFEHLAALAERVELACGIPGLSTTDGVAKADEVAALFERSPGAPASVLESDAWNAAPAEAIEAIERVRTLQAWRREIDKRFVSAAVEGQHAADIEFVERKTSGAFGFLAILSGEFRAIKRRWTSYRVPGYGRTIAEQAIDLRLVDKYVAAQKEMEEVRDRCVSLFGAHWAGERSVVADLERYVAWVTEMRAACVRHSLPHTALKLATSKSPDVSSIRELSRATAAASAEMTKVREAVQAGAEFLASADFKTMRERLALMKEALHDAPAWAEYAQARQKVVDSPAVELLEAAERSVEPSPAVPFDGIDRTFRRAVLEKWLENVLASRPALREFKTLTHEQRVQEFRQLDEWVLKENQASVVASLRSAAQDRLQHVDARRGLPFLQSQMAKQRNIAPLRRLLEQSEPTIRAIKPCFLMSPLTVAQLLDGRQPSFDVVIFDEASQLPPEDAIGAICRGSQLVVVGDPKQLPPTNFFAATTGASVATDGDGQPVIMDGESILEEYMGAGIPVTRLKWHYRSTHESLITFSNVSFYDSDLYTFPSVETGSDAGLTFEHIPNGVYEGKGLNAIEARRVADAVMQHAKERPHETLGVGTFNMRQQLAVQDELELRRRMDPSVEAFFARSESEGFFVKNLENIQGDERDAIFLSVTYAKQSDGRLRHHFGPINGENGWRRLNVLTTRARKRMRVFSSIRSEDINPAAESARGAQLLRSFLLYAEHGRLDGTAAVAMAAAESPFEAEVVAELVRRGVRVVPQIGAAGYRIDIGVLDDQVEGRFVCGIECDGVAYHSSETARDRDRLRQQVLEARGWIIHRVWSTDWFKDRSGQIKRLLDLIAKSQADTRSRVQADAEAEAEAKRRALEESTISAAVQSSAAPPTPQNSGMPDSYVRPTASPYQFAEGQGKYAGQDFLEAPGSHVTGAIVAIVNFEGPVHVDDVATRTAGIWGIARVGSRISSKVSNAIAQGVRSGTLVRRGDFLWSPKMSANPSELRIRSRSGTRMNGAHIPPEEVRAAIHAVLKAAGGLTTDELLSEVRQVLGVGRASLSVYFLQAVQEAVAAGELGESSAGLALREKA